jgi:DNA (cytosine-5)-methyltransferase 1
MSTKRIKAIDFFSGAGGLTHGLKMAGIDVLAGIDNDGTCKETFELNNHGAVFLERDIAAYSPADLERVLFLYRSVVAMFFSGCAPCLFWSFF